MNDNNVTYFAETDARNKRIKFGIKAKDRSRHVYVIGKTGMGKSTLLENMAVQDIQNGEGLAFVDPHGKTADLLLEYVPEHRLKDVVYFAPFDLEHPISFNVLENVDEDKRHLVVSGLMSTFKKIWKDAWSARMEYILTNTLLALLEYPNSTLLGVNRMLSDKEYRKKVVDNVKDPSVKSFWIDEFGKYTERMAAEAIPAIQNKIGQFTSNPLIRNMVGQVKSSFDLRDMMDKRKILIVNLSKGRIGDTNANLIGGMMITKIYLAAMSRADIPDMVLKKLPNFYLFVDEFQNFANESFADILSEARKYKLNLTIAHQYIEQMEEEVGSAVFGNVGTMITFRVGAYDAEVLEKEFAPTFTAEDIVNLGIYQIYLKLMIDGVSSQPFSAITMGPIAKPDTNYAKDVIEESRKQFSMPRAEVEAAIIDWHKPVVPAPSAAKKLVSGASSSPVSGTGSTTARPTSPTTSSSTISIRPSIPTQNIAKPVTAQSANTATLPVLPKPITTNAAVTTASLPKTTLSEAPIKPVAQTAPMPSRVSGNPTPNSVSNSMVNNRFAKTPEESMVKPFAGLKDLLKSIENPTIKTPAPVAPATPVVVSTGSGMPVNTIAAKVENQLYTKPPVRDKKGPSEKNLSDLKNVLSGVLKKTENNNENNKENQKTMPIGATVSSVTSSVPKVTPKEDQEKTEKSEIDLAELFKV